MVKMKFKIYLHKWARLDNVEICFSPKLFSLSLYIMLFIVFSQEQEDNIIISMLNFWLK